MPLLPHQQRAVEERIELLKKLEKLRLFLNTETFEKLTAPEQDLLYRQFELMDQYALVLWKRIEIFDTEKVVPWKDTKFNRAE